MSLFLMLTSFWMLFLEYITWLFWFLSVTEGIDVVVHSIAGDVWGYEDELTGALSDEVDSLDWLCL